LLWLRKGPTPNHKRGYNLRTLHRAPSKIKPKNTVVGADRIPVTKAAAGGWGGADSEKIRAATGKSGEGGLGGGKPLLSAFEGLRGKSIHRNHKTAWQKCAKGWQERKYAISKRGRNQATPEVGSILIFRKTLNRVPVRPKEKGRTSVPRRSLRREKRSSEEQKKGRETHTQRTSRGIDLLLVGLRGKHK